MSKAIFALGIVVGVMTIVLDGCGIGNHPTTKVQPEATSGVYQLQLEVGNSLYPLSRGASIGFERYLSGGEEVIGSLEWRESYAIRYKWSLYVYDSEGRVALEWNGADLKHKFRFTALMPGTYRIEILKRDFNARQARLTINPPDWDRWGEE